MEIILNASFIVKLVMLALVYFSIMSWAIIAYKYSSFKKAHSASQNFLQEYLSLRTDQIGGVLRKYPNSPLPGILREAQKSQLNSKQRSIPIKHRDLAIGRAVKRATTLEIQKLEKSLAFLATTSSTAPFIGLFGTVWGIMEAFHGIGESGSASLAVVAPGISEALIATAIGLVAAIPAAIAYNYFISKVNVFAGIMDNFGQEVITRFEIENENDGNTQQ